MSMLWGKKQIFFKYQGCKSFSASLILTFKDSERYWMASPLVVASEYLPPLCCSRPRFLILSCSAYLACAQKVEPVMSIASTPLPMWTERAPSHISVRTFVEWSSQCHTHANTQAPYVSTKRTLEAATSTIQVAMTDLKDVVDGGGQRPAYAGYL